MKMPTTRPPTLAWSLSWPVDIHITFTCISFYIFNVIKFLPLSFRVMHSNDAYQSFTGKTWIPSFLKNYNFFSIFFSPVKKIKFQISFAQRSQRPQDSFNLFLNRKMSFTDDYSLVTKGTCFHSKRLYCSGCVNLLRYTGK